MEITLAIADSRYYVIADTLCDLKVTFLLFLYSCYNGHLGRINDIFCCLIREHFVIQLIMKISEMKLRRFEAILTPLSSKITVVVYSAVCQGILL